MPPRKRRSRRQDEVLPAPEPVGAPAPEPAHPAVGSPPVVSYLDPRTGRAVHERSDTGYLFARRPGDDWRDRLLAVWRPGPACASCSRMRMVLAALTGEAGVCDLLGEIDHLARLGCCTCAYAPQET